MPKKLYQFILAILVIALFCGCSVPRTPVTSDSEPPATKTVTSEVTVVVTRDFGREVLLERNIAIEPGDTAMDALHKLAEVTTKYGGGFVNSINGLSSEYGASNNGRMDWFLYLNGVSSNVGANDYALQDGDIEQWDFRDWSYHHFVPATIGHFPRPFRGGYKGNLSPTIIVYEEWLESGAQSLVEKLRQSGITDVSSVSSELLPDEDIGYNNLIVLAKTDNRLISEINSVHKKLGLYAYFEGGRIITLDAIGNLSGDFGLGSGIIQATQNPWNPKGVGTGESVVWMVTGTDEAGIGSAVEALVEYYPELKYTCAAVISRGEIIRVPR